jgi:predicted nucleic acid-binding protein
MVRIYLDACALSRLTDDTSQQRVSDEAEAITEILRLISEGLVGWTASEALAIELLGNPDEEKRREAEGLLERAGSPTPISKAIVARANELAELGYGRFDGLHLASAEESGVDALLTTDDRFLRRATRRTGNPSVRLMNPIDWLQEWQ